MTFYEHAPMPRSFQSLSVCTIFTFFLSSAPNRFRLGGLNMDHTQSTISIKFKLFPNDLNEKPLDASFLYAIMSFIFVKYSNSKCSVY